MANLTWDHQLKEGQLSNPVIWSETVLLPTDAIYPTDEMLMEAKGVNAFKPNQHTLFTWGRAKDSEGKTILINNPHWIAVRKSTPLHWDPRYPRYSHQLKIRVDPRIYVRGLDKIELELKRGTYYVLDTHSPHQVLTQGSDANWNVSVSLDSHDVQPREEILPRLIKFAQEGNFSPDSS